MFKSKLQHMQTMPVLPVCNLKDLHVLYHTERDTSRWLCDQNLVNPSPKFTACFTLSLTQSVRWTKFFVNAVLPPNSDVNGVAQRPVLCTYQGSCLRRSQRHGTQHFIWLASTLVDLRRYDLQELQRPVGTYEAVRKTCSLSACSIALENVVVWQGGTRSLALNSFPIHSRNLFSIQPTRTSHASSHLNFFNHDSLHTVGGAYY
jgi:hypothetical protein